MSKNAGGLKTGISSWLFSAVFKAGWRRRILFTVAVIVFIILLSILRGGVNYQRDPSALAPRDAAAYVEARDLGSVLKNAAMWPLWIDERQAAGDEQWNHVQAAVANLLGENVHGLGSRIPMEWLKSARRGALSVLKGNPGEAWPWILYFEAGSPGPASALKELRQEPGVNLAPLTDHGDRLFELSGNDASKLYVGAIGPWFAVSSRPEPLLFAVDAVKRPALTLGGARLLPEWSGDKSLRGMFNPAAVAGVWGGNSQLARLAGWMRPDSRFTILAKVEDSGRLDVRMEHHLLGEAKGGGWLWSFVKFILGIVALSCLALAAVILAVMLGWSGWLKLAAERAGIRPAAGPKGGEPSPAFRDDAGLTAGGEGEPTVGGRRDNLNVPDGAAPDTPLAENAAREEAGNVSGEAGTDGEDSVSEPLETFPEIQDEDISDEMSGHLPAETPGETEETPPAKKKSSKSAAIRKPPLRKTASAAKSSKTAGASPAASVKPRKRPTRKKPSAEK